LVGHHGLLAALLGQLPEEKRSAARSALTNFDSLALTQLAESEGEQRLLTSLMRLRGTPEAVIGQLKQAIGPNQIIDQMEFSLALLAPAAGRLGVSVQLDPSFQPHFDLYDGLVFKLVCQGAEAPLEIASGGRYDALVGRFSPAGEDAAGMGFGFAVEAVRELLYGEVADPIREKPVLVGYGPTVPLAAALDRLEELHAMGVAAELLGEPAASQGEAQARANGRNSSSLEWVTD
ncbi:ATP phosphoribosyltransferase regulatory subunit, partial [Cyanobium sp. HWJ4-Hawea]|uniref:ATP phosphoribosyltransferase regulatory subunit n=1 Tax=Cyanobium sp. HWJ4-Hawea TaxID=2823713 RepID=UPI0020CC447A